MSSSWPPQHLLRVVQYNVRRFLNAQKESTVPAIAAALTALNPLPSIICLNEVDLAKDPSCLTELADALGKAESAQSFPILGENSSPVATVDSTQTGSRSTSTSKAGLDMTGTPVAAETGNEQGTPQNDTSSCYTVSFWGHVRGRYGNAILTSQRLFRIVEKKEHHLPGGSVFVFPAGTKKLNGDIAKEGETHTIVRGMLELTLGFISAPGSSALGSAQPQEGPREQLLTIFQTHLDHISEAERETQLSYVRKQVLAYNAERMVMLSGDLNSLTRSDYAEAEWTGLEERHKERGWNLPQSGCLDHVLLRDAGSGKCLESAGVGEQELGDSSNSSNLLQDSFVASEFIGGSHLLQDSFATFTADKKLAIKDLFPREKFTAHVGEPLYRIDYNLVNQNMLQKFRISNSKILNEIELSDHYPLCVDFMPIGSGSGRSENLEANL
ncbi:unnamed protein product [Amoebophrya sp. A25]|nr:unnamed protein product [Amoebophrya sp. A25]|eukprot:GSA25T00020737001.1